jgi:Na+/H+ antiporter NhaA
MQKIATRLFVCASIVFGVIGILVVLTLPDGGDANSSNLHLLLMKLLFATVFVILPSFALSVAGKYLNAKS